jgi:hypothetical protein
MFRRAQLKTYDIFQLFSGVLVIGGL